MDNMKWNVGLNLLKKKAVYKQSVSFVCVFVVEWNNTDFV